MKKNRNVLLQHAEKIRGKIAATLAMVSCYGLLTPICTLAAGDAGSWADDAVDSSGMSNFQSNFVDLIGGFGKILGVIMAGVGAFVLVQAFRNEDVDGKHRAGLYIGVAVAMFSLGSILEAFLGS